jgi:hypothetical protein
LGLIPSPNDFNEAGQLRFRGPRAVPFREFDKQFGAFPRMRKRKPMPGSGEDLQLARGQKSMQLSDQLRFDERAGIGSQ